MAHLDLLTQGGLKLELGLLGRGQLLAANHISVRIRQRPAGRENNAISTFEAQRKEKGEKHAVAAHSPQLVSLSAHTCTDSPSMVISSSIEQRDRTDTEQRLVAASWVILRKRLAICYDSAKNEGFMAESLVFLRSSGCSVDGPRCEARRSVCGPKAVHHTAVDRMVSTWCSLKMVTVRVEDSALKVTCGEAPRWCSPRCSVPNTADGPPLGVLGGCKNTKDAPMSHQIIDKRTQKCRTHR